MPSARTTASAWCVSLALGVLQLMLPPCAQAAGVEPTSAALLSVDLEGVSDSAGELPRAVREAVAEHLLLVSQARIDGALRAEPDPGCTTAQCAMRISAAAGARWLVRARVAASGSDYDLQLSLTDGTTGRMLPALKDRCALCGWSEVPLRLGGLARGAASLAAVTGIAPAGDTPSGTAGDPGAARAVPRRSAGLTIGKWLSAAGAVGLLAAGGVMFGVDGRGTCELPAEQAMMGYRCARTYDTTLEGGLFLGAGALCAATAAALFYLDYRLDHKRASTTPVAVPLPGGASIGVAGTF